ncbi:GH-E family nuclease [Schinkia azotoformans]|uniref:GH-E family nuclease n=1 Tax=Schinkia azotoformans TaxID=1454 RepID=UPI002E1D9C4D|nr:GH-E family nuclease [Schinkia azotoformans]
MAAKSVKKKAVKYVKSGMFLDHVQLGLDVVGMIPVAGTVAGLANAGISTARGNYAGAALDLVSCIPIAGTVTKGGKLGLKAAQATKVGEKLATTPKKLVNSPATDSKTINRSITNAPTPKSGKPAPSTGKGISRNSQLKSEPKLPNNLLDKYKVVNKAEMPWGPGNIVKVVKVEKGANLGKGIKKSINSEKDKPNGTKQISIKETDKSSIEKAKKAKSLRDQYLGRTPSKNSRTGREVVEQMKQDGKIRTVRGGKTEFKASDGKWYNIKEADMAHKTDAVTWWNNTGRYYGAKSKEVREWMLDSKNYYLEHYSINRSQGAKLTERYLPPIK